MKDDHKTSGPDYEALVNAIDGIAWEADPEKLEPTFISRQVERILGYTPEQWLAETGFWARHLHPDDRGKVLKNCWELLQKKENYELEYRMIAADGREVWLRDIVTVKVEDGRVTHLCGLLIDITEKKLAEQALRKQKEEQDIIFDSVPAFIWFKDAENRILRVNDRAAEILGMRKEEIEGRSTFELYPEEADQFYKDDLQVIASGLPRLGIVEQLSTPSRGKLWVRTYKVPFHDQSGAITGVIVFAVDITELKTAEEALLKAHDELEDKVAERTRELAEANIFFDLSLDLLCIADSNGNFRRLNPAWERALGYSVDELLAIPYIELAHPDDRQKTLAAAESLRRGQDVLQFENRYICKDGSVKWLLWSATMLPDSQLVYAVAHDITKRKQAEETVTKLNESLEQRVSELAAVNRELQSLTRKLEEAYDQALEASKLKSEFVANISHEIRTPISGVIGMTEILLDTNLTSEQRHLASALHESAQCLLAIINDILDFSKMEAGKVELNLVDFAPISLVEGTANLVRLNARDKALSLMTFIDPAVPLWLKGDPLRLRQILLNLLDNAIKFTDRGEVVLRAFVESDDEEAANICFSVTDTGIGLGENLVGKIFEPFVQADGSTIRRYGGTGLGLSICKRLVELMGGSIGVESEQGKGATFWFTVPLARSQGMGASLSSSILAASYRLQHERILVVDDSTVAPDIITRYLDSAGMDVERVTTSQSALDLLRRLVKTPGRFRAVVVNLSAIPGAAIDLGRAIRRDRALSKTPLVLVAAGEDEADRNDARRAGYAAAVLRPVRQTALIDGIARALGRTAGTTTQDDGDPRQRQPARPARSGPVASPAGTGDGAVILLVEDNPVLQNLALRQLQKLGLTAHVAANGREAVEAVRAGDYSLVLMDCQMPVMDGFEATREIRRLEKATGGRVPIVAMTAAAMPGDKESCLSAGMNDYLSKPVSTESLRQVMERWLRAGGCEPGARPDPPGKEPGEDGAGHQESAGCGLLQISSLREMYGESSLKEIVGLFRDEADKLLEELSGSLENRDGRALSLVAHQLKGLASVMTASQMSELSLQLEKTAPAGDWQQAGELAGRIRAVYRAIRHLIDSELS